MLALRQHREVSDKALSETQHRVQQLEREVAEIRAQLEAATDALARCALAAIAVLDQSWHHCTGTWAADCWSRFLTLV